MKRSEKRLEKLYWELGELAGSTYMQNWSADDIKMLNFIRLKIWDTIYYEYHDGENPTQLMRDMLTRQMKNISKENK